MKGIVVYYSGTGNNHKIGRAIYRGMKEVIDCDVASVKEVNPQNMGKYDLIGIGSPIWYFRETANVRAFIYNMPDMTGKLAFVFSCHGTMPANIFRSMIPQVQRKGLTVIGWNDWFGGNFYTLPAPKPYPLDGHPDELDLKEAEDWGREMAERARRIYAGEKDLVPEIPHGPDAPLPFQSHGAMQFFRGLEKPHRIINRDKCKYPECTLCVDNCVARAIDFSTDPPDFNMKTCLNCCLCDRMCPEGAIEIPDEELRLMRTMKTINMEKCKYPECTICVDHCPMNSIDFSVTPPVFKWNCEGDDLCWIICPEGAIEITNIETTHGRMAVHRAEGPEQDHPFLKLLAKAEEEGRFRRLTPLDKVGWDNIIYTIKRHPRFSIEELEKD